MPNQMILSLFKSAILAIINQERFPLALEEKISDNGSCTGQPVNSGELR